MSKNNLPLNQIISLNDNKDDLFEQKIKENEKIFENLDKNKNINNSQIKDNKESKIQKIVNEEKIKTFLNEKNNDKNIINKNLNKSDMNIKPEEKIISKKNIKNKIFNNNTNTKVLNENITKKQFSKKIIEKNNFKKINNYNSVKAKLKNKNRMENNDKKIIKDNVDLNLYTQYISLYSENNKKLNNSFEKRLRKRNETNITKSGDKSGDKSRDKSSEKFNILYNKFLEDEKKKNENIEKMRKEKEEQEKRLYIYKPRINLKSQELIANKRECKEDFYTRQKKLMEKYKKKDEELKERIEKEKEDLIKNSVLYQKYMKNKEKNKDNYKNIKSKLFDWEEKYKTINKSSKNSTLEKEGSDTEKDKAIYKIKVNRNINRIINRLYKADIEKRKQNLEILNEIYTPSFQPMLLDDKNITYLSRIKSKDNNIKNSHRSTQNINPKNKVNLNNDGENENEYEYNYDSNSSININNLLRNRLFGKVKKKERYRSAIKFNVINGNDNYEINYNNVYDENNNKKLYKHPKASHSFIRQNKYKI